MPHKKAKREFLLVIAEFFSIWFIFLGMVIYGYYLSPQTLLSMGAVIAVTWLCVSAVSVQKTLGYPSHDSLTTLAKAARSKDEAMFKQVLESEAGLTDVSYDDLNGLSMYLPYLTFITHPAAKKGMHAAFFALLMLAFFIYAHDSLALMLCIAVVGLYALIRIMQAAMEVM